MDDHHVNHPFIQLSLIYSTWFRGKIPCVLYRVGHTMKIFVNIGTLEHISILLPGTFCFALSSFKEKSEEVSLIWLLKITFFLKISGISHQMYQDLVLFSFQQVRTSFIYAMFQWTWARPNNWKWLFSTFHSSILICEIYEINYSQSP